MSVANDSARSGNGQVSGLSWVRRELDETLSQAARALEQHWQEPKSADVFSTVLAQLHEVRGVAVLLRAYGLALLLEEMKQTVQDMAAGRVHEAEPAYSAVLGACVQASDYLDLLAQGTPDSVLVLQPIINEMRLSRARSLLTEDDLFVAQFRVLGLQLAQEQPGPGAQAEAARLSPTFSRALLAWFKGQDVERSLSRIGRISELMAQASSSPALHQLWQTAAACVEALLFRTLDESLELKRQFGRAGQLMRLLAESGEAEALARLSDVSLRLLFYVGRSSATGARVMSLRQDLALDVWLPAQEIVTGNRARLRGANTGLLAHVAEELRTELSEVRDSIDVALRTGGDVTDFDATAQRLKRVADTLLMLGLTAESQALAQPLETLREAGAATPASAAAWMEFATAVLLVDQSLDAALYRQLQPAPATAVPDHTATRDLREGTSALLRESLVNVARIKGYIDAYLRVEDVFGLPEAARLLDEIAAGFRILGLERAEDLTLRMQQFLQSPDFRAVRSSKSAAARFADAVAAVEYYLEFCRDRTGGAERVLRHLETLVERLHEPAAAEHQPVTLDVADAAPAALLEPLPDAQPFELSLVDEPDTAPAPSLRLMDAEAEAQLPSLEVPAPRGASTAADVALEPFPSDVPGDASADALAPRPTPQGLDPEIREVFIEEAQGVLVALQSAVPAWLREPDQRELLVSIRRAFHTLKGSGRMVGAGDLGEFAWAIESLLNRVLDGTVPSGPPVQDAVRESVQLLPALLAAFREGGAAPARAATLAEQARQLAAGQSAGGAAADLVLVFRNDAMARLQLIRGWLGDQRANVAGFGIPERVLRAFHTLRGAALAIEARAIGELAGSLETYLDALQRNQRPLPDVGLALLEDCCNQLGEWVAQFGQPVTAAPPADPRRWLDRVEAVRVGVESAPGAEDEDRQLAEIFSFEALDLVQQFEADLLAWARAPESTGYAQALKAHVHTLKGAAGMAQVQPIYAVTEALNARLAELIDGPAPQPAFFGALKAVVDGLYAQLDAYRDGRLSGDGSEVVAQVQALDPQDILPVIAATPPGPAQPSDQELIEVFLGEGEELVEEIEQHAGSISAQDPERLGAWQRALHTLKGSARMAGVQSVGEVAHWLETATEDAQRQNLLGDASFRAPMRVAVDGLHQLLEHARKLGNDGLAQSFEALRQRYDAAMVASAQPPALQPAPVAETDAAEAAVDAELLALFAPEAEELFDSLRQALAGWRAAPYRADYPREMQRELHTFKGGARMAGLRQLGDAAQALEAELLELEHGAVDANAQQQIAAQLDALRARFQGIVLATPAPAPAAAAIDAGARAAWSQELLWTPRAEEDAAAEVRREAVRVPVERLDSLLNQASEVSIYRSRLEENHATLTGSLSEMAQTITRVREQLRLMDIETEAQIAARGFLRSEGDHRYEAQFDPLEMDRYSRMQELSRALTESLADLSSLHASLDGASAEAEVLLQQQGRVNNEVQQSLMGSLMVPFSRQVQRLARVVRQTAQQNDRLARAEFAGAESELDRNVLERMTAPLEHLMRNAVVHGIESPSERLARGKPAEGQVQVTLRREGSQLSIEVRDDGRGLDYAAIRAQAVRRGLMRADAQVSDDDLGRFVFAPGFSTALLLTQDAGRGIGLDVVAAEVKQLGGTVDVASEAGRGIRFRVRLPLTLAVAQALVVQVGEELFAVPLAAVEGIARVPRENLAVMLRESGPALEYGGQHYQVTRLGDLVGIPVPARQELRSLPAILMRLGEGLGGASRRVAVVADRLIGNREIVTKAAGPILGAVPGISGATILADGRVMLIVDVPALIQESVRRRLGDEAALAPALAEDSRRMVMVVDDSITIRRVTERLLNRKGYRVVTAKDGLDAMAALQTEVPDAVLLDIEMPRADGFEVAAFIRNTPRTAKLPIIMITSRSGDKHREHARALGVDRYLIKPYQEDQLLFELGALLGPEVLTV